jgi:hypothetical protein
MLTKLVKSNELPLRQRFLYIWINIIVLQGKLTRSSIILYCSILLRCVDLTLRFAPRPLCTTSVNIHSSSTYCISNTQGLNTHKCVPLIKL